MPQYTIFTGLVLIVTSVTTWLISDSRSGTAFIPAGIGAVLIIAALFALKSESARRHVMHAVMLIALLGAAASIPRMWPIAGDDVANLAVVSSTITFVALVALVVAGVRSFRAARLNRA